MTLCRRALFALTLAAPALARRASAEEAWPSRPVRIVVPFGPGGPIDTIGRMLADQLRERLGQPFVIDNRPGAGGSIGIRTVVQSPADGSVLLLTSASLASVPALYPGQGLDPREALTPVSLVADVPTALVVRTEGPFHSVHGHHRRGPGRGRRPSPMAAVAWALSNHLSGALFASAAGVKLEHISYRGAAPAMTALLCRRDRHGLRQHRRDPAACAGRTGPAARRGDGAGAGLPDTPAIAEIVPGYVALNWYAIAAPQGCRQPIVAKLRRSPGRACGTCRK